MAIAIQDEIETRLTGLAQQLVPPTNKTTLLLSIARRACRMDAHELTKWLNEPAVVAQDAERE